MILVIDNYDSFTYNIVQQLGELGVETEVHRNDEITVDQVRARRPERIVISPGPGGPPDAGVSCEVIRALGPEIPVFGCCLGHQCIGAVYGARIVRAARLMHGKTSPVHHDGRGVFRDLPDPFEATRYHSLIIDRDSLPGDLTLTAWTEEDEIMGVRHAEHPVEGVQFHPESILTVEGRRLLENFLARG
ncbi:anthranilate synthase component II [Kiritimatiella glycovorans]|uniref:Anthranilate synthase component II n=1 Tax=Kiritimatiella glycovorans TaxID=1307763 RepID=A0A0G3EIA3_9BACT|nr:aminodeoxychorismate/anthranilate synthase component II [Kiritimatiella glycovorans]AKJ63864.1 Anthranilate synthase component II [Kiritimatiella glycovorans]